MKKIKKGCTAVIFESVCGNEGILVTVGDYLGVVEHYVGYRWQIDCLIKDNQGKFINHVREDKILRIVNPQKNNILKELDEAYSVAREQDHAMHMMCVTMSKAKLLGVLNAK